MQIVSTVGANEDSLQESEDLTAFRIEQQAAVLTDAHLPQGIADSLHRSSVLS